MKRAVWLLLMIVASACSAPPASSCACTTEAPACDGCPAKATELCTPEGCVAVAAADVDVRATLSVARDFAADMRGFLLAVYAAEDGDGPRQCSDVGAASANVLDGTVITATGAFHPDIYLGRVPAGDILVYAEARDVENQRLAAGCEAVTAAAPTTTIELIQLQ
jgi:hypothetical protein